MFDLWLSLLKMHFTFRGAFLKLLLTNEAFQNIVQGSKFALDSGFGA